MSELSAQGLETRLGVVDAVEASGVGIELVEVLADTLDGGLLGLERQRLNILGANLALEGQGNPPGGLVILGLNIASRQEAGLANGQSLVLTLLNADNRETKLLDPGAHNGVNIDTGSLAQGVPESLSLGVSISVALEVEGNTLEEGLDAKVRGQHANHRAPLEVADLVENLIDIESVANLDLDGVRSADRVEEESLVHALVDELRPHLPVRVEVVGRKPTSPGSETLVKPELIPPVHSNKVTEPLVSKFVGNNVGNAVAESGLGELLVKKNSGHTVGDKTPVLHGAVGELVDGQDIALGKGVVDLELLREVVDDLGGVLKSPHALLLEAAGGVDADRKLLAVVLAVRESLDVLEVTDSPGKEVGAHDRAALERDDLLVGAGGLGLLDGHVGKGDLVLGDLNGEIECGLEVGLVEAGEGTASIARLELGAEHVVELVVAGDAGGRRGSGLVLGAVETGHVVVELTGELEGQ